MAAISVLFFLRRIGPYHHARFQELNKALNLTVVETRPGSEEYPWQFDPSGSYAVDRFMNLGDPERGLRGQALKDAVAESLQKFRPQFVVTTGWADPEYHAVILEASARNLPLIVISDSRYEDEPRKFHKEFVKRLVLRSYSAALVAGKAARKYLIRLGFDESAIFQPWDVVDNQYFSQHAHREVAFQERYFLCISRFIAKKNLTRLIEAFGRYKKNGGRRKLLLLGSGELEGPIKNQISNLRLSGAVELAGFVQYEELPDYLSRAFALILPSVSDQWGLVVNEAMASALPVLVSNQCGCAIDLVYENENGYTFDPYQVGSMAEAMVLLDNQDEVRWKQMSNASQSIIARWNLNDFANGIVKACEHARNHSGGISIKLLHRFLSR